MKQVQSQKKEISLNREVFDNYLNLNQVNALLISSRFNKYLSKKELLKRNIFIEHIVLIAYWSIRRKKLLGLKIKEICGGKVWNTEKKEVLSVAWVLQNYMDKGKSIFRNPPSKRLEKKESYIEVDKPRNNLNSENPIYCEKGIERTIKYYKPKNK